MGREQLTTQERLVLVAVVTMYFFAPTQGIVSAVLSQIGDSYPDVSTAGLTYLVSINNLCAVPSALLFSVLAGRRLSYRAIGVTALALFVVGGGLPAFLPDSAPYGLLLFTRAVMGLGRGCFVPLIQAVFIDLFHDETRRSAMFGVGSVFFNIGATAGTTIAGALGLVNWHLCFVFYLFAIIPLVLFSLFFKEPRTTEGLKREKLHVSSSAWVYFVLVLSATIASQMLWNYASPVMAERGIGSLEVGTVLSMFTIAATVVAALFAFVWRGFKTQSCAFGLAVEGLGFMVLFAGAMAPGVGHVAFYLAAFLIGFGANAVVLSVPMVMSVTMPASAVTAALGLSEVFHNLGGFASSPFSQLVFAVGGPAMQTSDVFVVTGVFALGMAGVASLVGRRAKASLVQEARNGDDAR